MLDDGPLSQWPEFFAEDCLYRIASRENERRGLPLPILLCDSRAGLYDRVEATEKANIFEPHWYRHILSQSRIVPGTGGITIVETAFLCLRTMLRGVAGFFVSGVYRDEIVRDGNRLLFRSKTVVLDKSQIDTLIAIPL